MDSPYSSHLDHYGVEWLRDPPRDLLENVREVIFPQLTLCLEDTIHQPLVTAAAGLNSQLWELDEKIFDLSDDFEPLFAMDEQCIEFLQSLVDDLSLPEEDLKLKICKLKEHTSQARVILFSNGEYFIELPNNRQRSRDFCRQLTQLAIAQEMLERVLGNVLPHETPTTAHTICP